MESSDVKETSLATVLPPDEPWREESLAAWKHQGSHEAFSWPRRSRAVHWSVAWSDLMMTMFILFLVLYLYKLAHRDFTFAPSPPVSGAVAQVDAGQDALRPSATKNGRTSTPSIAMVYQTSQKTLASEHLKSLAAVDLIADQAVRIVLTGDLLFDTGSDDLKPQAVDALQEIAEVLRPLPYTVNVVGHTDNLPIHSARFPTNWELSLLRACKVARFLIEEMKIPGHRFFISGHAFYQQLKPNNTLRNRAANRRVEIVVCKERPFGQAAVLGEQAPASITNLTSEHARMTTASQ